eukprot:15468954-Alexandrium_andersonii.AAC.1
MQRLADRSLADRRLATRSLAQAEHSWHWLVRRPRAGHGTVRPRKLLRCQRQWQIAPGVDKLPG